MFQNIVSWFLLIFLWINRINYCRNVEINANLSERTVRFHFIAITLRVMMNGPAHSGCSLCKHQCRTSERTGRVLKAVNFGKTETQRFVSCFDFFVSSPATKWLFALITFVAETLRKEESHHANIRLTSPKPGSEIQKYKKLFCTGGWH